MAKSQTISYWLSAYRYPDYLYSFKEKRRISKNLLANLAIPRLTLSTDDYRHLTPKNYFYSTAPNSSMLKWERFYLFFSRILDGIAPFKFYYSSG